MLKKISWIILISFSWEQIVWANPELAYLSKRVNNQLTPPMALNESRENIHGDGGTALEMPIGSPEAIGTIRAHSSPIARLFQLKKNVLVSLLGMAVVFMLQFSFFIKPLSSDPPFQLTKPTKELANDSQEENRSILTRFIKDLEDDDVVVRANAAQMLGRIRDPRAVEPLIRALFDKEWPIRESAARSLGQIGDRIAGEPLISALLDPSWSVRANAAKALGEIQYSKAAEQLMEALRDTVEFVREEAAEALGKIKDQKAVGLLTHVYENDKNESVREKAMEALQELGTVDFFIDLLNNKWIEDSIRAKAAKALGGIANPRAIQSLRAASNELKNSQELSQAAKEALSNLRAQMPKEEWRKFSPYWKDRILYRYQEYLVLLAKGIGIGALFYSIASWISIGLSKIKFRSKRERVPFFRTLGQWAKLKGYERIHPETIREILALENPLAFPVYTVIGVLLVIFTFNSIYTLGGVMVLAGGAVGLWFWGRSKSGIMVVADIANWMKSLTRFLLYPITYFLRSLEFDRLSGMSFEVYNQHSQFERLIKELQKNMYDWPFHDLSFDPIFKMSSEGARNSQQWVAEAIVFLEDLKRRGDFKDFASFYQALLQEKDLHRRAIFAAALGYLEDPKAIPILVQLIQKDEEVLVRLMAASSIKRLQPAFQGIDDGIVLSIVALHPEWAETPPSIEKVKRLGQAIAWLPPEGGKVRSFDVPGFQLVLHPTGTAEELSNQIITLRQEGQLGQGFVLQLSVQGSLPDEFKYAIVALLLASPYQHDWNEPYIHIEGYEWEKVQPLVHGGRATLIQVNPLWGDEEDRTDLFLIFKVREPRLEDFEVQAPTLEQAFQTLAERAHGDPGRLRQASLEARARDWLRLSTRATQCLADALHSARGTAPRQIPGSVRRLLSEYWLDFKERLDAILAPPPQDQEIHDSVGERPYNIHGIVEVPWFLETPIVSNDWRKGRFEAPFKPIQQELIRMGQVLEVHPEIHQKAKELLEFIVNEIEATVGLQEFGSGGFEPPSGIAPVPEATSMVESAI